MNEQDTAEQEQERKPIIPEPIREAVHFISGFGVAALWAWSGDYMVMVSILVYHWIDARGRGYV